MSALKGALTSRRPEIRACAPRYTWQLSWPRRSTRKLKSCTSDYALRESPRCQHSAPACESWFICVSGCSSPARTTRRPRSATRPPFDIQDGIYIRTWQGWLYLAAVVDLYSRKVVGWSMKATLGRELVLDALLAAVWRRKPTSQVLLHSVQGSQYGSDDFK